MTVAHMFAPRGDAAFMYVIIAARCERPGRSLEIRRGRDGTQLVHGFGEPRKQCSSKAYAAVYRCAHLVDAC